jgi:hypothetical protein
MKDELRIALGWGAYEDLLRQVRLPPSRLSPSYI